jgi:plastocyanin
MSRLLAAGLLLFAVGVAAEPVASGSTADTAATQAEGRVDHSQMDHAQMDHSQMDHSQMQGMDHSQMNHGGMDHSGHGGHDMEFDAGGMVMNTNRDRLPPGCPAIQRDYEFTVRAGTRYAEPFSGDTFGMSQHGFDVEPCSRITFTFINEDAVRHQFMVHKLPRDMYPQGMFHIEAAGGATKVGTLIVPGEHRTYLVHCDIAQHMEQGMKGQIKVGRGNGDLTSIPGLSVRFRIDNYHSSTRQVLAVLGGFCVTLLGLWMWRRVVRVRG